MHLTTCIKAKEIIWLIMVSGFPLFAVAQQDSTVKKRKKFNLASTPVVSYNNTYGVIVGANSMIFFRLDKKDTISPPSAAGLGGGYSQNRSWFGAVFTQLYLRENRWRVTLAGGMGLINFQYFEAANEAGDGSFVDYNSVIRFAYFQVMRKIYRQLYGGVLAKLQYSKTTFETTPEGEQRINANGIGVQLLYDSRDNVYNPSRGARASIIYLNNTGWMGSDSVFSSLMMPFNFYYSLSPKSVLAARVNICRGVGNVPFIGQQAIGGKDIRGYTDGKYRGNQAYSAQLEYRWNFYKRWGAVGFMGIAFTGAPASGALPGGGLGIRFMMVPSYKINVGIDAAVGRNDTGLYFRIGEAF